MTTIAVTDETLESFKEGKVKAIAKLGKMLNTDEFIIYLLKLQDEKKC